MPAKKLRVRLLVRIAHIGREGEIVEVSHSFAMHSLLPKKLAVIVTPEEEKRLMEDARKKERDIRTVIEEYQKIHETLHAKTIAFELRGNGESVFGGISETEILAKIAQDFGYTLEKKHIVLPESKHLKKAGNHDIRLRLGHDLHTKMTIVISVKREQ